MIGTKENLLVVGANGLVGSKVKELIQGSDVFSVISPSSSELDVRDRRAVFEWVAKTPSDVIVNFAGYTDVDGAERQAKTIDGIAWETNVRGAAYLAEAAKRERKFLIHISTAYVLGAAKPPYIEETKPVADCRLLGWYAYTKLLGERLVKEIDGRAAILRIDRPFGNPRTERDFALKLLRYIKAGHPLLTDQFLTPTYIPSLVRGITKISKDKRGGIYHFGCRGEVSPFEFGKYFVEKLGLGIGVKPGSIEVLPKGPNFAPRPKYLAMDFHKSENTLGETFPTWQEALDEFAGDLRRSFVG